MFVVLLRFSANRAEASRHMDGHKAWLERGFAEGKFLLSGSIEARAGGAILMDGVTRENVDKMVAEDPFVVADVVTADIIEITPGRADQRLQFLLG